MISIFLVENVKLNSSTANSVKFHLHIITLNIKAKYTHQWGTVCNYQTTLTFQKT